MTTQQRNTIAHIEATHEAQRFEAAQAARDVAELDAVAVLIAVEVKMQEGRIEEGRIEEARALVAMWRASKGGK
jgi:hypothetical protein